MSRFRIELSLRFCLFFGIVFTGPNAVLRGQDLYDFSHSKSFANYLMQSRQFDLAAHEYDRLVFMKPENDTLRTGLLRALRLGGHGETGLSRWNAWQEQSLSSSRILQTEYAKTLIWQGEYLVLRNFLDKSTLLDTGMTARLHLYALLLQQSWPEAQHQLDQWPTTVKLPRRADLEALTLHGNSLTFKKPAVAALLSVAVPGLGKAYAGQWKDGLISLVFVGINTWQAYRRFDQEGLDTFWGWVHGGLGLGFYIGNVYGSHKAARMQNARKRARLLDETKHLVFPALD